MCVHFEIIARLKLINIITWHGYHFFILFVFDFVARTLGSPLLADFKYAIQYVLL